MKRISKEHSPQKKSQNSWEAMRANTCTKFCSCMCPACTDPTSHHPAWKKLVSPAVFYCAESRHQIGEKHASNLQSLYCRWSSKTHAICWKYMHQIHQLNSWFPNSTVKTALAWNVWTKAIQLETSHLPRSHTWLTFIFVSSFVG